ncbi:MAG: hypothetical protein ACKVWR_03170 [Acidimicrobiales bacterium]
MRTTISISDELFRAVKVEAVRTGRTIGQVVEDALLLAFARAAAPEPAPPLPTFGERGLQPGVELSSNPALAEVMERGTPLDARR